MKHLQIIFIASFLAISLSAAQIAQQVVGMQAAASVTQTPGFISETGQNSTLTIALATSGGAGIIPTSTCNSFSYCINYAENSASGDLGIIAFPYANGGTAVTATGSDSGSNSYTCSSPSATDSNKLVGFCYSIHSGAAHQVSVKFGTTAVTQVHGNAALFTNIAASSTLRTSSAVAGSSSTTMTGPTVSTSANDLVYAYFCRTGTPLMTSGAFTLGSGFTAGVFKYQDGCASEWEVSTGGNVTPTMTMGSASTYLVLVAVFEASTTATGTAPVQPYLKRFQSWSSAENVSGATIKFQVPSDSSNELVMTEFGAANYAANSVTDSGSNTWTLAGQCVQTGSCSNSGGYSSEFYVTGATANATNTQTVNFTGTGDATINWYEFVGIDSFDRRTAYSSSVTTTTLAPPTAYSFLPYTTSVLYVSTGGLAFNTATTVAAPSGATNYFDGGYFGGETINGGGTPESVIGQNNIWSHGYQTGVVTAQNFQWNMAASTSEANLIGADVLSFLTNAAAGTGLGVRNQAVAQTMASVTDLQITVPATVAGNLLAISTAFWDGATLRTVSNVCTGTSATCATGTQFTQASGATSAGVASTLLASDIWYLLSAPAGVTTVTVVYSGTTTISEVQYWEVEKGGGTWATDGAASVHNGASCSTTCSGGAITVTGSPKPDWCLAHLSTAGSGVTANPKSGNAWIYSGTVFTTGNAATSLLAISSSAQTPQWTAGAGVINASDACFK